MPAFGGGGNRAGLAWRRMSAALLGGILIKARINRHLISIKRWRRGTAYN